ncbi:hypothetical protein [Mycobacteroides abscessus]|uniref:hypothetical protein n=1 Tax=Mycobacteroides abscessus TaxID=36809 RepID=UPI00210582EA|nr:hypothetical protein [Mycobacteroides abscessus]
MHTPSTTWTDYLTGPLPRAEILAATPPSALALTGAVAVLLLSIFGVWLGVRWSRNVSCPGEEAQRCGRAPSTDCQPAPMRPFGDVAREAQLDANWTQQITTAHSDRTGHLHRLRRITAGHRR